jgi:hypothetical protein
VCPHCKNKHRITWLWPLYKHLRITRVPTVFSRNLPLCRKKNLLCTDLKRFIWKFYHIFSPSLFETFQANVKISFFFSASDFFKFYLVPHSTLYRLPGFLSSRPNRITPPPHPQGSVAPPPFGSKGGDTFACGGGGGWTQFRRRDKHSGILNSSM